MILLKGISSIIVVILLLLISVSLASVLYLWFSSMMSGVTKDVTEDVGTTTSYLNTRLSILSARNTSTTEIVVTVRNSGTNKINLNKLVAFVDEVKANDTTASGFIDVGDVATFEVIPFSNLTTCQHILKLSVIGSEASRIISC